MDPDTEDYADVEIYVRPADVDKGSDEERVWEASYEEMARFSDRYVIEAMRWADLGEGQWEVGIRERGDEQYHHRFELTPLMASNDPTVELENLTAAILNHWRA